LDRQHLGLGLQLLSKKDRILSEPNFTTHRWLAEICKRRYYLSGFCWKVPSAARCPFKLPCSWSC